MEWVHTYIHKTGFCNGNKIATVTEHNTYLAAELEFEEEVQQRIRQTAAERVLQVDLVPLEHLFRVLAAPGQHHPDEMVLQHRNHRVGNVALLLGQGGVQVLVVARRQLLHDDGRVGNLLPIDLDERQLSLLRAQLQLMVDVLRR